MNIRISRAEGYRGRRRISAITALAVAASILSPAAAHAAGASGATAAASSTTSHPAASTGGLTKDQAVAQARKSDKSVLVTSATTATSTLTANPNSTLTLTQSVAPVRKEIDGTWQNLDATLIKTAHGYAPRISTDPVTFSPGGAAPLATLGTGTSALSLTLPKTFTLTTPTVTGATATYHDVLPGVDLEVTADIQGGFSESLIVENATAAHNPALASIAYTVSGHGVALHADKAGNLTATGPDGAILYTAPAPTMWDSTATGQQATGGQGLDSKTGAPLASTAHVPGATAHTAPVAAAVSGNRLTLTPNRSLLTGAATKYPEYIDPTYTPTTTVSSGGAYAYTSSFTGTCNGSSDLADVAYYDDSSDYLRTGYSDTDCDVANYHTFLQIPVSGIAGSVISTATATRPTLSIYNSYSGSCTAETTDLYQTGTISSKTTWNNEPTWNSTLLASASYANGYSSSCNSGGDFVGFSGSNLTSLVQSAASGSWNNITFGLKADTASVSYSIRHYTDSATLTITYDYTPSVAAVTGNPTNLCESTAALAATHPVGLDDAVFEAKIAQKLGTNLTAMFYLYNASGTELNPTVTGSGATTTTSSPTDVPVTAGQYTALRAHEAFFTTALALTAPTTFHWHVTATDGTLSSSPSKTCYFTYDPTSPGNPTIASATDPTTGGYCPSIEETAGGATATTTCIIGTTADYTLTDTNTKGGTVGSYRYQLNGGAPIIATPSTATSPYTATITLKPTRGTNLLTVTAVSAAGNVGGDATIIFIAQAPPSTTTSVAGDLSGDGLPDLITVGNATTTPAGLWEANDETSGKVETPVDIGYQGDATACNATAFNGDQAITGDFYDSGMQGVLTYNPSTTAGAVFSGTGDGSAFQTANICGTDDTSDPGLETNITADELYDQYYYLQGEVNGLTTPPVDTPLQLANAYHAYSGDTAGYDDLIGTNHDAATGAYFLTYFENSSPAIRWATTLTIQANTADNGLTPAGGTDWNNWRIATTSIDGVIYMYLWDTATGALYLWTNLTVTSNGDGTGTLAYTNHYEISPDWSTTSAPTFEAADITGTGIPDIWTVSAAGTVTATLISSVENSPTITTATSTLSTGGHNWALNDYGTTGASAADNTSGTALTLNGSEDDLTNTGDMFSPDIILSGSDQYLDSLGNPLTLTNSFTLSLWARPEAYGGVVVSQGSTNYPGLAIFPTQSGWEYYLADDNGTATWDGDSITGGTTELGTWAHIQATYNATTHVMSLYVDDTLVADASHTTSSGATGRFYLGADVDNSELDSYYDGQIADVHTWSGTGDAYAPNQPATPAAYHQAITPERILDTRLSATNTNSGIKETDTPIGADSTITVPIVGDTVTPVSPATLTKIPTTATAVAVDVTLTNETSNGNLIAYGDQSQIPVTSSTNYAASTNTTGYQIVPLGPDGKIAFYNSSTGTTHLLVDITGYYTTDPAHTLTGDQTYHPLTEADRLFDTRSKITYTPSLTATGPVAANSSFTVNITGDGEVPTTATAVAINLTAVNESGSGLLEASQTGGATPTDTSLSYSGTQLASLSADVSLGTGTHAGQITITNTGTSSTDVIGDIAGYYTNYSTTDPSANGQVYHTVNPTRLADTRIDLGGVNGPIAGGDTYPLTDTSQNDAGQITSAPNPTYALMLTVTQPAASGDLIAYPDPTQPGTSNLNWSANQTVANLALVQPGTDGTIDLYNSSDAIQLVIDCSGFFAGS